MKKKLENIVKEIETSIIDEVPGTEAPIVEQEIIAEDNFTSVKLDEHGHLIRAEKAPEHF